MTTQTAQAAELEYLWANEIPYPSEDFYEEPFPLTVSIHQTQVASDFSLIKSHGGIEIKLENTFPINQNHPAFSQLYFQLARDKQAIADIAVTHGINKDQTITTITYPNCICKATIHLEPNFAIMLFNYRLK